MNHRANRLLLTIFATVCGLAIALTPSFGVFFRTLVSLPSLLLLPGYLLMMLLLPKRSIGPVDKITFSLGLSLAVAVLVGLVLNWTPWGLQAKSWVLFLGVITICLAIVAELRQSNQVKISSKRLTINFHCGLLFGLAGIFMVAALAISSLGALKHRNPGFTQFWILPVEDATLKSVRIGISNYEGITMAYNLQLKAGDTIVAEITTISLESGEKWETEVNLSSEFSSAETIEASLYRLDMPESIYRQVYLWH